MKRGSVKEQSPVVLTSRQAIRYQCEGLGIETTQAHRTAQNFVLEEKP